MTIKAAKAYRIFDNATPVGHIFHTLERDCTADRLLAIWGTRKVLDLWQLPASFDYLWVDEVFVHYQYRRQGWGDTALRSLIDSRRVPTFFALGPGDIDHQNPTGYRNVCAFYRSLGFRLRKMEGGRYGFLFVEGY